MSWRSIVILRYDLFFRSQPFSFQGRGKQFLNASQLHFRPCPMTMASIVFSDSTTIRSSYTRAILPRVNSPQRERETHARGITAATAGFVSNIFYYTYINENIYMVDCSFSKQRSVNIISYSIRTRICFILLFFAFFFSFSSFSTMSSR